MLLHRMPLQVSNDSSIMEHKASIRIELCDILDPEPMESFPTPYHAEKSNTISPCRRPAPKLLV
jgi:hypothetical protein